MLRPFLPALFAVAAAIFGGAAPAFAQADGVQAPPPAPPPRIDYQAEYDWIKLDTGEWLKGELKSLRQKSLEFDSDKLDDLTFKWKDIREIRSPREWTVVLLDQEQHTGQILLKDGKLEVTGPDGGSFTYEDIYTIVPTGEDEFDLWTGKISFGVTVRSGNTNQGEMTSLIFVRRRGPSSRIDLQYNGTVGVLDNEQNVNNHRLNGLWAVYLSRRLYVTPVFVEAFRDPFQNIGAQITPGIGGGYAVVDTGDISWDLTVGAGARYTKYFSVSPGATEDEIIGTVLLGTVLDVDLTSAVELKFDYSLSVGVPDTSATNHNLLLVLSLEFIEDLDLDVTFQWTHIGDPARRSDGTTPQQDDFRLSVGLGWEF